MPITFSTVVGVAYYHNDKPPTQIRRMSPEFVCMNCHRCNLELHTLVTATGDKRHVCCNCAIQFCESCSRVKTLLGEMYVDHAIKKPHKPHGPKPGNYMVQCSSGRVAMRRVTSNPAWDAWNEWGEKEVQLRKKLTECSKYNTSLKMMLVRVIINRAKNRDTESVTKAKKVLEAL